MSIRLRFAAILLVPILGLGLAACDTPPRRHQFADLTYAHLPDLRLDVAVIDVVDGYRPPLRDPHVEHLFPVQPAAAATQWARDRLAAAGPAGAARFTVLRASVVEVPLDRTTGVQGYFTEDQSERYEAVIEVRLDVENASGLRSGSVTARAERSQTVSEDMTLNEREKAWYDLTEALMRDLDTELERNIRQHLAVFLR